MSLAPTEPEPRPVPTARPHFGDRRWVVTWYVRRRDLPPRHPDAQGNPEQAIARYRFAYTAQEAEDIAKAVAPQAIDGRAIGYPTTYVPVRPSQPGSKDGYWLAEDNPRIEEKDC